MKKSTDLELAPLVEHPYINIQKTHKYPLLSLCKCLCLPFCLITLFVTSIIVLSTQVERRPCIITCVHRPTCNVSIGNHTYITHQGSCSWREEVAQCVCYMADGIVTVNPFILLSPIWTLVAVLSGGALSLFTLALLCWCCCRRPEQTY